MKLNYLSPDHTKGVITAEIALCSFAVIILFSLFFTITGYCSAYLSVKEYTDVKIRDCALTGYILGFDVPGIINTSDFGYSSDEQIKNLIIVFESWGEEVRMNSSYTYVSLLGKFRVKMSSSFTRWAGDLPKTNKIVWDMPPIERGKVIEEVFGGGLPEFFPVLDAYDEISGNAASIVSIDTTLSYYDSGIQIKNTVYEKIKEIEAFKGGKYEEISITEKDIENREVIVVIPENQLNERQHDVLLSCIDFASSYEIKLTVKRYQYAKKILPGETNDIWNYE